jgi:hypothetical protein
MRMRLAILRRIGAGCAMALIASSASVAGAQTSNAGRASSDAFVWAIVLIAVVLVGFTLVFVVRKRALAKGDDTTVQEGFMAELRRLRDSGQISPEEFDATRRTMARKLADRLAPAKQASSKDAPPKPAPSTRAVPAAASPRALEPLRPDQLDPDSLRELEELRARAAARRAAAQRPPTTPQPGQPPSRTRPHSPPAAPPTHPQQPPTPPGPQRPPPRTP